MCSPAEAGSLATLQPQADPQASARPCFPGRARMPAPGRGFQEEGGSPEGRLQPARRGCPLPSHVAWWVATDLKLEKSCPIDLLRVLESLGALETDTRWTWVAPAVCAELEYLGWTLSALQEHEKPSPAGPVELHLRLHCP